MGLLVTFFLASILFSFLCSLLEAVLLSTTPAYVGIQEQNETAIAKDLVRFKADIDEPLVAILTLNTIAHTAGAIGVGAQATVIFGDSSIQILGSALPIEALIAGFMTLAILELSEIIPKTLGANYWEALTPFTVRSLKMLLFLLAPLVKPNLYITRHLKKDKEKPVLSRTDFIAMARLGTESGVLEEKEQTIIHNLLRFSRVRVKDVMTPRIVVIAASDQMTIGEFHEQNEKLPFSRIPVFHEQNDNVTGYILKDELLLNLVDEKDNKTLNDLRRDIIVVHKTLPIPELLDTFVNKKEQIALVVDEFGGMDGIVTMEDIIETLLGLEIVDESDNDEDMQALARKNWVQRARRLGIISQEKNSDSIQTEEFLQMDD